MKTPFFSIIIPTYNSAGTLAKSINSVLQQTFKNFEIWIIDGKSSDSTIEIIQSFQKKAENIHYLSEPDNGVYDAMNKGIKHANGKWLYFLGSDDSFFNDLVLEKVHAELHSKNNKILLFYGNANFIGDRSGIYDGYFNTSKILKKNICHQACFFNNAVFCLLGSYNPKIKLYADYDFNLKIFGKFSKKIKYANIIIANYNTTGLSNSSAAQNDNYFNSTKWNTIVKHFGYKLLTPPFHIYHRYIIHQYHKNFYNQTTMVKFYLMLFYYFIYLPFKIKKTIWK